LSSIARTAGRIGARFRRAREAWPASVGRWAVFVHMWSGAAAVLYILALSLSGCVVLFERDLYRLLSPDPSIEPALVQRLSGGELINVALSQYPQYRPVAVWDKKVSADLIAEIWLDGRGGLHRRLLNPYTGADLGAAQPAGLRILASIRQLHTNLLAGKPGRILNGLGSLVLTLLAVSALVGWMVRRAKLVERAPESDNIRSFHRRVGIWIVPFAALWGATGVILSGPAQFSDAMFDWAYAVHAAAAGGSVVKTALATCALLMSILVLAGAWTLMGQRGPKPRGPSVSQFFGPPSASSAADMDFPSGSTISRAAATKGSDFAR